MKSKLNQNQEISTEQSYKKLQNITKDLKRKKKVLPPKKKYLSKKKVD